MNAITKEAIDRVHAHADLDWFDHARLAVVKVAAEKQHFTTDDVWHELSGLTILKPHHPCAMGAVMKKVQAQQVCVPLHEWWLSTRPECHERPLRVWKSLIRGV